MNVTKRIENETRRDYALRMLKDNIINLELKPGSMVSENELAAKLGLSRGPVREALIELAKVKIVEVYPQRGIIISSVDYSLVQEACFMRETLEVAVVERCCTLQLQQEHLQSLQENVKLQRFYLESNNTSKILELDNEFHSLLFLAAGLNQIYILMNIMLLHFDRVRVMSLTVVKDIKTIDDHFLILDAVIKGDAETAKTIMHKHLNRYTMDWETIRMHYPDYVQ